MSCLVRTTAPEITPWPRLLENRSVFSGGESLMTSRNVAGRRTGTHERGRRTVNRLLCLPLTGPIGSRGLPQAFVMEPTDAWQLHHPALARWLHTPRLRRVLRQR